MLEWSILNLKLFFRANKNTLGRVTVSLFGPATASSAAPSESPGCQRGLNRHSFTRSPEQPPAHAKSQSR